MVVSTPVHWLNGGQNIGPTVKIIICKIIHENHILLGGASSSPPIPTNIGGVGADNYLVPSKTRLPPDLSLDAGRQVLDGSQGVVLGWGITIWTSELLSLSLLSDISADERNCYDSSKEE